MHNETTHNPQLCGGVDPSTLAFPFTCSFVVACCALIVFVCDATGNVKQSRDLLTIFHVTPAQLKRLTNEAHEPSLLDHNKKQIEFRVVGNFTFISIHSRRCVMKRVTFKVFEVSFLVVVLLCNCLDLILCRIFQLPNKEPISLTSRLADSTGDKKKPFSRPFSKGRLEPTGGGGSGNRMSSPVQSESNALLRQNQELRQRLQEESSSYRRRLDTYKTAQSNQSALVSRLQAKVLQYKQRCSELENQMSETVPICPSYAEGPKSMVGTSTPLPSICPKSSYLSSSSNAPMSLPVCPSAADEKSAHHYSDESDESFDRKRIDEERKL